MSVARSLPPLAHALHQVVVGCFLFFHGKTEVKDESVHTRDGTQRRDPVEIQPVFHTQMCRHYRMFFVLFVSPPVVLDSPPNGLKQVLLLNKPLCCRQCHSRLKRVGVIAISGIAPLRRRRVFHNCTARNTGEVFVGLTGLCVV